MQEYASRINTTGTWHSQDNQASYQWVPENQSNYERKRMKTYRRKGRRRNSLDIQIIQDIKENST